uniref:Wsv332-like protein n=1 Tax=Trachysalambria curvirostris nimavirus TaxID=2984282 RepID=A0A9C7BIV1_9VIRU|nr:MAG: wsv332-like protein [Trachysalambria curvirostris nimavirus]
MMESSPMDHSGSECVTGQSRTTNVVDQAGMCVVNFDGISRRIKSMTSDEMKSVYEVSERFLSCLIRLSHCADANLVKETGRDMIMILLRDIFDPSTLKERYPSYVSLEDMKKAHQQYLNTGSGSATDVLLSSVTGCLDPVTILTELLDDGIGENKDAMTRGIDSILSVLKGYNPIKLDDIIVFQKCQGDGGCTACRSLQEELMNPNRSNAGQTLVYLLRCLNHRRFLFGGDLQSARASEALRGVENNTNVMVVDMRSLLLNYVDCLGGATTGDEFLSKTHMSDSMSEVCAYSDDNPQWEKMVRERVRAMPLQERGVLAQVYSFLICSRHRQQTGDFLKQFLYTIFARFIYSATDILFCEHENASKNVDGGKFLKYFDAWSNMSAISSSFQTMKGYLLWRTEGASVATILNLFSANWNREYRNEENLRRSGNVMARCISGMAEPTRLGQNRYRKINKEKVSGLDSFRSVRSAECYMPYGILEPHRGNFRFSISRLSPQAANHSNGRNIPFNCLHILPSIDGANVLGRFGHSDQAAFEDTLSPGGIRRGSGKALGLITSLINRCALGSVPPTEIKSKLYRQRVNEFMSDVIFRKMLVHEETANASATLPDTRELHSRQSPAAASHCFDARIYTLFLLWQRPCIPYPNMSALTTSQLELMLSKDPKWATFITNLFFNIERVSFQLTDSIIRRLREGRGENDSSPGRNVTDLFTCVQFNDAAKSQELIDKSIDYVSKEWSSVSRNDSSQENVSGTLAHYSSKLFELLYEIIIVKDMDPQILIKYSDFLHNYIRFMDELLMKLLRGASA